MLKKISPIYIDFSLKRAIFALVFNSKIWLQVLERHGGGNNGSIH
jgi:hypothetical protein